MSVSKPSGLASNEWATTSASGAVQPHQPAPPGGNLGHACPPDKAPVADLDTARFASGPSADIGADQPAANQSPRLVPIVFDLPLIGNEGGLERDAVVVPVLGVPQGTGIELQRSVCDWVLVLRKRNRGSLRGAVNCIGQLCEYVALAFPDADIASLDRTRLAWDYLCARRDAPSPETRALGLNWGRASDAALWFDYLCLQRFHEFCLSTAHQADYAARLVAGVELAIHDRSNSRGPRLLAHLEAKRARWRQLVAPAPAARPGAQLSIRPPRRSNNTVTHLSSEEIEMIITSERNRTYRALWILLAYGGVRVSEAIQLWVCDVLPPSASRRMTGADMPGLPLIITAHPSASTYVGDLDVPGVTRKTYLERHFGLSPRNELYRKHRQFAGWKGMLEFDSRKLSWVSWIDAQRAREFAELYADLREVRRQGDVQKVHPYVFVVSHRSKYFGRPLSIRSASSAWARALQRVGIRPKAQGSNLHGLRHYYKWYARSRLKMSVEEIQLMMRHRSIESQRDYGRDVAQMRTELSTRLSLY